jgi:hypothetical protein
MSPEQLTGDTLDGRSDLYALALVTFNMLTGMLPFTGQTTQEALLKRLTDPPLSLAEARPDLAWPPALQAVLSRALARLASDRYQHASEFGSALVAAVAGSNAGEVQSAPTQVMPGATPTLPPAPVSAPPALAGTRTAREKYFVPAIVVAWLVVIVGGAMLMRLHRARATDHNTVASAQPVDSASSQLGAPVTPASAPSAAPVPAATPESASVSAPVAAPVSAPEPVSTPASATAPATAPAPPPAPPPAPAPAPAPSPVLVPSAGAASRTPEHHAQAVPAHSSSSPPVAATKAPVQPTPPAAPAAVAAQPLPAPASTKPANADQARASVDAAGRMVDAQKPLEAMVALRDAMPLLPTRDDSVTALFHLARAMIQRAGTTGDVAPHQRGCAILTLIAKATSHPKAGEIRSFASQECK